MRQMNRQTIDTRYVWIAFCSRHTILYSKLIKRAFLQEYFGLTDGNDFLASIIMNFFQSLWVFPKGNCGNEGAWWQLFQSILFVCILHWSFFSVSYRNGKREGYFLTKKVTACCKVYRHSSKYYISIDILDMNAFWAALSCSQQESNIEWEIDNILCQFWQTD